MVHRRCVMRQFMPRAADTTVLQRCSRWLLSRCGWQLEGDAPPFDRCVVIAAPHTSNWDFPWMLLMAFALGMPVRWLGKHTLFRWPFGGIMRALGGIAVERSKKGDRVQRIAETFRQSAALTLLVPPEGTRSRSEHWRSGFYQIARVAEVPIVFSYLDFGQRRGGIGPALWPSDDMASDMDQIRAFYAPMAGLFPELSGPVRLREELDSGVAR